MLVVRTAPVPIQFAIHSSPALGKYTLNNRVVPTVPTVQLYYRSTLLLLFLHNNKCIFAQCRGGMDSKMYGDRPGAHNEHRATAFPSL